MDGEPVQTVPAALKHWATVDPDTPAFIFVDANWKRCVLTRADLYRLSSRYAAILRRHGVKQGHIICNTLPNSPQRLLTDLGIQMAGGVAMNGQLFLADGKDFVGSLKEAACFGVILDPLQPKGAAMVLEHRVHTQHGSQVDYPELPDLKRLFEVYMETHGENKGFFDILNDEQETYMADVAPTDFADVWTTSGSTGFSKLVPMSHESMLKMGDHFSLFVDPHPGDIYYNDRSLGWGGGFPGVFLTHGTTRVLLDNSKGLPEDTIAFEWEVMCREKCTVALLVPAQLLQMTDVWEREGVEKRKLRTIGSGGQPLKKKHMEAIGKLTDCVHVGYGSTECGIISVKVVTDKDSYEDCNNGTAIEAKLRVVDKELKDVGVGEFGEILVQSSVMFNGYLNNPKATQRSFTSDGWFKSGDIGCFNEKGEIFTVCRQAFTIMRGPYLIYPGWLEHRIGGCPGIEDVIVVPVPDPLLYQELCACIVPCPGVQLTAEGVRQYCSTLFLTSEKSEMTAVPKYYLFFDVFPTTNTGKTCRRSTAVIARKRLGMEEDVQPVSK